MTLNSISKDLLSSWIAFSKKWPLYNNSSECERQWDWFNKNNNHNYTIGSLIHFAKHDNYDKTELIRRNSVSTLIAKSVGSSGSHADVANVIYHYYKEEFVCDEIKNNSWYYFNKLNGGKWEETEAGHILRTKLSGEIVDLYNYYGGIYKDKAKEMSDDEDASKLQDDKHTKCLKIQIQLKDSGYKDKVMKECKEYFYDKKFNEKLNYHKHILGFEN